MKTLLKPPALKGIRLFFSVRFFWPVWFYLLNRESRRLFSEHGPDLDSVQRRITRDLTDSGIAVSHIDELFPGQNIFPALARYTQDLAAEKELAQMKKSKPFLEYLWDERPTLDGNNPFGSFVLHPRILDVVNAYLSVWSRLYYLTLNITHPVSPGAEAESSQRWHRDPEDKRQCKVFLYMTDVDEKSGPFTYMRHSTWGSKWGNEFRQRPPKGCYPENGAVEKKIPEQEKTVCTAKAGTIIFCDTTGIHRGGYATDHRRIMFTAGFVTNGSASPRLFRCSQEFAESGNFSACARYALQAHRAPFATYLYQRYRRMLRKKSSREENAMARTMQ